MLGAHAEALEPHVTICIGSWTTEDLNKVDDLYAPLLRLCVDLETCTESRGKQRLKRGRRWKRRASQNEGRGGHPEAAGRGKLGGRQAQTKPGLLADASVLAAAANMEQRSQLNLARVLRPKRSKRGSARRRGHQLLHRSRHQTWGAKEAAAKVVAKVEARASYHVVTLRGACYRGDSCRFTHAAGEDGVAQNM
jgi:hypothetical protein